jgi:polyribonucleotide nucleotidyltransferase
VVKRVVAFGAFVEFLPGKEGLVHISELDVGRVRQVEDIAREGDTIQVKLISIDDQGKMRLSRRAVLQPESSAERKERSGRRGRNRR